MSSTTAAAASPAVTKQRTGAVGAIQDWVSRNRYYLIAFALPALLTYIAYAIFGLYPFGEESVLCLDLNGQYVYYFEAIRDAFWGDGSIWYNWSRNLSGEFMGIIGYYLASPFTLIVILLPERFMLSSLLIMQLCKLGMAGFAFNYYIQKSHGVDKLNSLIFSTMYAMMAYAVIQLIDPMWLDGVAFLPLIMLGVEYLVDDGRRLNFIIPLAIMCFANFYIGYMVCIFVALYFFFYLFAGSPKKPSAQHYAASFVRIGYSAVIALCCAAFMLLPVYNALKLGKFDFTDPDYHFRFQNFPLAKKYFPDNPEDSAFLVLLCDLLDMLPQFFPAQYDSVNVQGKPEIYCGLLTVVLTPLFFMNSKIKLKKKLGYVALLLVMLTCMLITPVDMWWHGGQSPNWLPFRYSFVVSFIFLSMAAAAFGKREGLKRKHFIITGILLLIIVGIVAGMKFEQMAKGSVAISAFLLLLYLGVMIAFCGGGDRAAVVKKSTSIVLSLSLLLCVSGELLYNTVDSMKDIDEEVAYSTRKSYQNYMYNGRAASALLKEQDDSFYRAEKTFNRCVNDDIAFGLRGISHSSSVMNTRIINFIETLGFCMHSYYTRYDGNTSIADSILGIKYVLDRGDTNDKKRRLNPTYEPRWTYDYTDQDGLAKTITIYENPNALSIGYMADKSIEKIDHLGNDNPFNTQNLFLSTLSGQTTFDGDGNFDTWNKYYTPITMAEDPIVSPALTESPYGEQHKYDVTGDGDPTIDFHFMAETDEPIMLYFKTEFRKSVNLWLKTWTQEEWDQMESDWRKDDPANEKKPYTWSDADTYATGHGGFTSMGEYFEGDNYIVLRVSGYDEDGTIEAGSHVTVRMTVANEFTIFKNAQFYTYHPDLYEEDIARLQENQFNITKYNERKLTGTITAKEGQVMMTTIPYQPGWSVKVDGKKYPNLIEEVDNIDQATGKSKGIPNIKNGDGDGMICLVNAMIGLRLTPGEHTVTFSYTPPGWWLGILLLVLGIACLVFFWFGDRKRYAAMVAERERLAQIEAQQEKKRIKLRSQNVKTESSSKLLEKLTALHEQGILTDAEFDEKKKTLEKAMKKSKPDKKSTETEPQLPESDDEETQE